MIFHEVRSTIRPLRWLYGAIGLLSLGLGIVGLLLPLWPTTPFLIVAAACLGRASPRLGAWLEDHPRFGPTLRAWSQERAIPRRAKAVAAFGLLASWLVVLFTADRAFVPAVAGVMLAMVGVWILTRPKPAAETA